MRVPILRDMIDPEQVLTTLAMQWDQNQKIDFDAFLLERSGSKKEMYRRFQNWTIKPS